MYSTSVLCLSIVAGLVAAQNVIEVTVGGNAPDLFVFNPSSIQAEEGDVVQFSFSGTPGNHSVTQSTFQNPCTGMDGGFDSGWVAVPAENTAPPATWNLTITSTERPIWFYCKQLAPSPHCNGGMVGAINAPTTGNTFEAYRQNVENFEGTPAQDIGGLVGNGASASAIPGPLESGRYVGTPTASGGANQTAGEPGSPDNTAPGAPEESGDDNEGAASTLGFSTIAAFAAAFVVLL